MPFVSAWRAMILQILKSIWASRAGSISIPARSFRLNCPRQHRPLCGGGRYDKLIESFGGAPTPGAGFAFQFDALVEAFIGTEKTTVNGRKDYFIAAETPERIAEAQRLAETLRKKGKNVEVDLMGRDLQAQQDYANQANYDYLIRLVPDEPIRRIQIKTGDTQVVTVNDLINL